MYARAYAYNGNSATPFTGYFDSDYRVNYWDAARAVNSQYVRWRTGYIDNNSVSFEFRFNSSTGGSIPIGINAAELEVHVNVESTVTIPGGKSMFIHCDDDVLRQESVYEERLKFSDDKQLIVEGSLSTDAWPGITMFMSRNTAPSKGDWNGIVVHNAGVITLVNSEIMHATTGVTITSTSGALSSFQTVTVHDCSIYGAFLETGQFNGYSVSATQCDDAGLYIKNSGAAGSPINIDLSEITNNGHRGLEIETSEVYVHNTDIAGNGFSGNGNSGLYVHNQSASDTRWTTIRRTKIFQNQEYGIHVLRGNVRGYLPGPGNVWDTPDSSGLNCIYDNTFMNMYNEASGQWELGRTYYDQFSTAHFMGSYNSMTDPGTYHGSFWWGYDGNFVCNYWYPAHDPTNFYTDGRGTVDLSNDLSVPPTGTRCSSGGKAVVSDNMQERFEALRRGPGSRRPAGAASLVRDAIPTAIQHSVHPNPFNPTTVLTFTLPEAAPTVVRISDGLGRIVATLQDGWLATGSHRLNVDARTLPSGLYFYSIVTDNARASGKLLLAK